jgi:hypothetical protein
MLETNVAGLRLFPALPDRFDLLSASPEDLVRHGVLAPRPSGPDKAALIAWKRRVGGFRHFDARRTNNALTSRAKMLRPQPHVIHRVNQTLSQDTVNNVNVDQAWNGVAVAGNWNLAQGIFFVPGATVPSDYAPSDGGNYEASIWVGLDGQSTSNDVLQAGVTVSVDSSGNVTYTPWFEWIVDGASKALKQQFPYIDQVNIPMYVTGGDLIYVAVAFGQGEFAGYGSFGIINLTRYTLPFPYYQPPFYTSPPFGGIMEKPTGANASGDSAEWIVETPGVTNLSTNQSYLEVLPNFGSVLFNGAANSANNVTSDFHNGIIDTVSTTGKTILADSEPYQTMTNLLSSTAAEVIWVPPMIA